MDLCSFHPLRNFRGLEIQASRITTSSWFTLFIVFQMADSFVTVLDQSFDPQAIYGEEKSLDMTHSNRIDDYSPFFAETDDDMSSSLVSKGNPGIALV